MRKSFNGLSEIARSHLGLDPLSGAAFLFTNRRRNLIKNNEELIKARSAATRTIEAEIA